MVDYRTEEKVRAAAIEFRKKHNALDFSATVDHLISAHGYQQDEYGPTATGLGGAIKSAVLRVGKKVKAIVSVTKQLILLSDDLPSAKHPFAKGHELGHAVLPWHKDVLYVCDEHDLSPATRLQMMSAPLASWSMTARRRTMPAIPASPWSRCFR